MIQVLWPYGVNTRFFAKNEKPINNVVINEYMSGRKVGYQLNTKGAMSINCSLLLNVDTELETFWDWYNNELCGTAGSFKCTALGSKVYRFAAIPEPSDTDNAFRRIDLEIEEV